MTAWAPGRVATFAAGEWIVTVTSTGDVRIWRNGGLGFAYTMLEATAMELRRALGEPPTKVRAGWRVEAETASLTIQIEYWPQPDVLGIAFAATPASIGDLREGLGKALDAIHRHHHPDSTLAQLERDRPAVTP